MPQQNIGIFLLQTNLKSALREMNREPFIARSKLFFNLHFLLLKPAQTSLELYDFVLLRALPRSLAIAVTRWKKASERG